MTKQEAIKWKPEIEAFQQGKTIQIQIRNKWIDDENPLFSIKSKYRIKPEQKKQLPTIEEVEKWFLENRVFVYKDDKAIVRICIISRYSETPIWTTNDDGFTISQFCEQLTHYDGSELYITE